MPRGANPRTAIKSNANATAIEGLADFRKALRVLDEQYPKQLTNANNRLAREIVKRSKTTAREEGRFESNAAKSLRANRSASSATVTGGGPRYPTFWAAEFGAKRRAGWYAAARYADSNGKQFKPWRGNQWGGWDGGPGYFLHPTIRKDARSLIDEYMKELDALTDAAFPG